MTRPHHIVKRSLIFIITMVTSMYAQTDYHHKFLETAHDTYKFCTIPLDEIRNADVIRLLDDLKKVFPEQFMFQEIGRSLQDRPIFLVKMGSGKTKILLWSQMHGDEPTATAALFDIFNYLLSERDTPFVKTILENTTILAVPMLNPDGAEVFERRNAQDIDINRDARDLQSPEGRILYNLQKIYQPDFGFNLHDQDGRRTVGNTDKLAAIALMAPPYDYDETDNEIRLDAKKVVSVIYSALGPYIYGHVSKYDADYMPRAFGDAMQHWGVRTVLIEAGGWYEKRDAFLQKMNFIALLSAFHAIASDSYKEANPAIYDALEENGKLSYDMMIKHVLAISENDIDPYQINIAINYNDEQSGRIADLGDTDIYTAKNIIEAEDLYLSPGFVKLIPYDAGDAHLLNTMKADIQNGYTTFLIFYRSKEFDALKHFTEKVQQDSFPGNVGTILIADHELSTKDDSLEAMHYFLKNPLGVLAAAEPGSYEQFANDYSKKLVQLPGFKPDPAITSLDGSQIRLLSNKRYQAFNIPRRGKLKRGYVADFVLLSRSHGGVFSVETVYIQGHPVYDKGQPIDNRVIGGRWF